jgi:hypothetical protein
MKKDLLFFSFSFVIYLGFLENWNQEMDREGCRKVLGGKGGEVAVKGAKRAISILFFFRYG